MTNIIYYLIIITAPNYLPQKIEFSSLGNCEKAKISIIEGWYVKNRTYYAECVKK